MLAAAVATVPLLVSIGVLLTSMFGLNLDSNTDIAARDPEPIVTYGS